MTTKTTEPTRVQFTQQNGTFFLADALRYPAAYIEHAPSVLFILIGGPSDKKQIRTLAFRVAGEIGLSLDETDRGDLLVVGLDHVRAEWGADCLVAEIQKKLNAAA